MEVAVGSRRNRGFDSAGFNSMALREFGRHDIATRSDGGVSLVKDGFGIGPADALGTSSQNHGANGA
jgi:hypothetical protein